MNGSHAKNLDLGTIVVGEIRQISKYTDYGYQWFSKIVKSRIQVFKSAEVSASVFKKAIRLTPEQLAADPAFIMLARQAIRAGKKYTAELCLWEHKQTVIAAVDIIRRTIVEQEEAEQQRHRDAQQAEQQRYRDAQ